MLRLPLLLLLVGCIEPPLEGNDLSTYPPDGYTVAGGDTTWADDFSIIDAIGDITAIADAGGGDIRVTCSSAHNLVVNQYVRLLGTAYDAEYVTTNISDTTHFDVTAAFVATDTGTFHANKCGLDMVRFEDTQPSASPNLYWSSLCPVEEGMPYRASVLVQADSVAANNTATLSVSWFDAGDNYIGGDVIYSAVLSAVGTWDRLEGIVTAPAGARYGTPVVTKDKTNTWHLWLDDIAFAEMPVAAQAYRTGSHSIANGATTVIQFDTETFDYGNIYDTSTYRFTAPTDGLYLVDLSINPTTTGAADGGMKVYVMLYINGALATYLYGGTDTDAVFNTIGNDQWFMRDTTPLLLSAGDYIDFRLYHTNTANIFVGGPSSTVAMYKVE